MAQHQHCAGLSSIGQGVCARRGTCARYADWTKVKGTDFNLCAGTKYGRFMPLDAMATPAAAAPMGRTLDLFGSPA